MRQIALDTETTGIATSEGHRIIEIAAVEMINRRITKKYFHYYINPRREIDKGAQEVHGITLEFLKDKPLFADIAEEFISFVKDSELIIHNAAFDTGFINYEFKLLNKLQNISEFCKIIDTLSMARTRHPGQKNNLDALCKRYNIDNSKRELHGALLDAELLARVYLAMTGGQSSLFGDETNVLETQKIILKKRTCPPLRVIKATMEEENSHTARLLELEKSANHS